MFITINCKSQTKICGYLQSYKYFDKYENIIIKTFEPSDCVVSYIKEKYKLIDKIPSVAMHVRRGDYIKQNLHISSDYLHKSINYVEQKIGKFRLFVCSDDIEWCKNNIQYDNCIFSENEKSYIDLYLMSLCDHNIISNSTFSWWSAYLNKNMNKIIIYPQSWKSQYDYDISDFLPNQWTGL